VVVWPSEHATVIVARRVGPGFERKVTLTSPEPCVVVVVGIAHGALDDTVHVTLSGAWRCIVAADVPAGTVPSADTGDNDNAEPSPDPSPEPSPDPSAGPATDDAHDGAEFPPIAATARDSPQVSWEPTPGNTTTNPAMRRQTPTMIPTYSTTPAPCSSATLRSSCDHRTSFTSRSQPRRALTAMKDPATRAYRLRQAKSYEDVSDGGIDPQTLVD